MKIVVLDGATLNPGDLSWSALEALGPCTIYDRTPAAEVVARAGDAEIVLTNKTPLPAAVIERLPSLRYIGVLATGYNVVAGDAARARGVPVTNVPDYGTQAVAQHALALLLELSNHVGLHARSVATGAWARSADFCFWEKPLIEWEGKTLGLIGAGKIGKRFAAMAEALGMRTRYATRKGGRPELEQVFRKSDVISLHCPLTVETQHLIRAETLTWMKPTAFLLNTSRGALVNEQDLADALNAGRLAGAAVDVLSTEPPSPENPLLHAKNCLVTPHHAWAAQAARARLLRIAVENVRSFLASKPENVVN